MAAILNKTGFSSDLDCRKPECIKKVKMIKLLKFIHIQKKLLKQLGNLGRMEKPFLVVCPNSVLYNWTSKLKSIMLYS
jgi:hypothetical protein